MPEPATSDNPFAAPETGLLSVTDGAAPSLAGATTDGQESFYVEYEYDVDDSGGSEFGRDVVDYGRE